jgi:hypothetical protein
MARLTVSDRSRHHDNRRVIVNIAGQFPLALSAVLYPSGVTSAAYSE